LLHHFRGFTVFFHHRPDARFLHQLGVGFFLAGVNVVHDDGTARRNGFVHRHASLGNDQVMVAEQIRQLVGPAENLDAPLIAAKTINQFGSQVGITARNYGYIHIGLLKQTFHGFARFFLTGMNQIKNAASLIQAGCGQVSLRLGKFRADREPQDLDLVCRHPANPERIGDGLIRGAEEIARSAKPGRAGFQGFGNNRDKTKGTFAVAAINLLNQVAVSRTGRDHAIRLGLQKDFFQRVVHPGKSAELPFHGGGFIRH